MTRRAAVQSVVLGLLGALVGGVAGYHAFFWIASQGLYALILPPAALGLGAGIGSGRRSVPLAVVCGVAGLALGLFTEWRFAPFVADERLGYFLRHVADLRPMTLIMIAVGTVAAARLALGYDRPAPRIGGGPTGGGEA